MVSNQKLFSVGNFDFRLQHLLVIAILALSVSISMMIRSQPASYGFELFEFDPFFNYRATEYILENGFDAYFDWIDEKSWYPFGRDVSETSQVSLHIISALMYKTFGFGSSLYDFVILFPLVIGSLTAVTVFAFVRVLGGTTAGLFAALIFSISVPIFTRGLIGWFKSEPLGLFLAFLAIYLFVSGFKTNKGKISLIKIISAAFFLSLGLSAWGGIIFFTIPIAIYFFSLPFIKHEKNFVIWTTPVFSISFIAFALLFERTSLFVTTFVGISLLVPTIFVIASEIIKKFSNEKVKLRNTAVFLISLIIGIPAVLSSINIESYLPSFRYLNVANPFLTSQDALTDSVAEHMTTNLSLSFTFLSFLIIFALIGAWFLLSKKTIKLKSNMRIFALITSILAIYVSSAFVRLELFASVGIIILGSIGLSILIQKIFEQEKNNITKFIFPITVIALFIIPVYVPEGNSWIGWSEFPPSILNGGSQYSDFTSNDWLETTTWLKENTSEDAVIASWWDYGYWITTLSDRATVVDNSTLIDWQIKKIAFSLITTPENSWHILSADPSEDVSKYIGDQRILSYGGELQDDFEKRYFEENGESCKQIFKAEAYKLGIDEQSCNPVSQGIGADYLLIFLSGERFYASTNLDLYTLEGGGDESKKSWFAKISGSDVSKFIESDNITPTPYFMEKSTLGKLTPFSIIKYAEPNTGRTFDQYYDGLVPVYVKNPKFLNPDTDPFYLVYASPSFYDKAPGVMNAVLVYKINPNYQP